MSILENLIEQGLVSGHGCMQEVEFETYYGSKIYGTQVEGSDTDIISVVMPPLHHLFPTYRKGGYVEGFGKRVTPFDNFWDHDVQYNGQKMDVHVQSIVKFFRDTANGSADNIAVLFANDEYHTHVSPIGRMILNSRPAFLSRHLTSKLAGFSKSEDLRGTLEWNALGNGSIGSIKKLYTAYRLVRYATQILRDEWLDPAQDREILLDIRNGNLTMDDYTHLYEKEFNLYTKLKERANLPDRADDDFLQSILLDCIEMKYGVRR
jgi:hypothetical protein